MQQHEAGVGGAADPVLTHGAVQEALPQVCSLALVQEAPPPDLVQVAQEAPLRKDLSKPLT
jgi:hypothetical protein